MGSVWASVAETGSAYPVTRRLLGPVDSGCIPESRDRSLNPSECAMGAWYLSGRRVAGPSSRAHTCRRVVHCVS